MEQEQEVSDEELEQMLEESMDELEEDMEDLDGENVLDFVEIRRPGENELERNGQEVVAVLGDLDVEELEHETSSDNDEEEEPDQDGQKFDTQLPTQHSVSLRFEPFFD